MSRLEKTGSVSSWEDTRNKAIEKIKRAAEDSDSELLEDVATKEDPKRKKDVEVNCQAIQMIVSQCLEDYREGEYNFKQTVKELCLALNEL